MFLINFENLSYKLGVYKIEIDSKEHRVVVTGNVESGTLIKKLTKSGKNAELWPKDGEASGGDGGEKKMDQTEGPKNGCDSSGEEHAEEKGGGQAAAAQGVGDSGGGGGGGGGGKKKKKKKKKGNTGGANAGGAPAAAGGGSPPHAAVAAAGGPVDQTNESSPRQQVFTYPQFYYPAAEYGMSYNSAPPAASMASSYYTLPMYSYVYSRPESYPTHLSSDSIRDVNHDETGCSIM